MSRCSCQPFPQDCMEEEKLLKNLFVWSFWSGQVRLWTLHYENLVVHWRTCTYKFRIYSVIVSHIYMLCQEPTQPSFNASPFRCGVGGSSRTNILGSPCDSGWWVLVVVLVVLLSVPVPSSNVALRPSSFVYPVVVVRESDQFKTWRWFAR